MSEENLDIIRYIVQTIEFISENNKFMGETQVPRNIYNETQDHKPGPIQQMV